MLQFPGSRFRTTLAENEEDGKCSLDGAKRCLVHVANHLAEAGEGRRLDEVGHDLQRA